MKNVTKQLKKITQGLVRDRGIKWFTELGDKSEVFGFCRCMYVLYVLWCASIRKECESAFVLGHEKLMAVQRRCGSSSKSFPTTIRYSERAQQAMIYVILLIGIPLFLVPQAPLRARERGHRRPQHCSSAPEEPQGIKHLQACRSVL